MRCLKEEIRDGQVSHDRLKRIASSLNVQNYLSDALPRPLKVKYGNHHKRSFDEERRKMMTFIKNSRFVSSDRVLVDLYHGDAKVKITVDSFSKAIISLQKKL